MPPKTNYQMWVERADPSLPTAKAMRRLRKKTGLSQRQFGKLAKFSQGYLGMIERGICQPKYNTLTRVIKAFNKLGVPCSHEDFGFTE
jgi:predicted transcriptional regulator